MAGSITCWTACLALLLVPLSAQNFETGDNSTVKGCSTHCSYHDKDLSCWTSNLNFFERVLLGQIRHYVSVQINIDQFNKRHQGAHYKADFKGMRDDSIKRISSFLAEDDFINHGTIDTVITELVGRVENKSQEKISWMPSLFLSDPVRIPIQCVEKSVHCLNDFERLLGNCSNAIRLQELKERRLLS
ncbi:hypothetical protein M3Y97_00796600 [Aphelenchoides bicaudatus]|nr:hypothetical protein M3Y97_00796600 [Aphelenchoides bicaudatus]